MLERLRVAVRPRSGFEAMDLGFTLLRAHLGPVYRAWFALTLPATALLFLLLRAHPWIAALLIWWLKPLLDRIVLHVLGRATFGEVPTVLQTLGALPSALRHGTVASLTWRRLGLSRSFLLPVWQLEGQRGPSARQRCRVLLRQGQGQAALLTLLCFFGFERVIHVSTLALAGYLQPQGGDFSLWEAAFATGGAPQAPWVSFLLAILPVAALLLVEPFYVAGGFGLYLNRRVQLEGWDLELAFRSLAARATRVLGRSGAALILLLALALPCRAADPAPPTPAKQQLQEVLQAPEFQVTRKARVLRLKQPLKDKPAGSRSLPAWLEPLLRHVGLVIKVLLVAASAALVAWLLWRSRRSLGLLLPGSDAPPPPERLFGLDIRPAALPPRLWEVADRLWAEGRTREALALLYRGALAHMVHGLHLPVAPGATEGDCLALAAEALPAPASAFLERLTGAFTRVAYGGQSPRPGEEQLCAEWPSHFTPSRKAP